MTREGTPTQKTGASPTSCSKEGALSPFASIECGDPSYFKPLKLPFGESVFKDQLSSFWSQILGQKFRGI
jgi:hypothetical protein